MTAAQAGKRHFSVWIRRPTSYPTNITVWTSLERAERNLVRIAAGQPKGTVTELRYRDDQVLKSITA